MAVRQVCQRLASMSVGTSGGTSCIRVCSNRYLLTGDVPQSSLWLLQSQSFHVSSALLRKLDNRREPPNEEPSSNGRWEPRKKFSEMYEYTTKKLPFPKTGGRGPNGKIWNHARGGGHKRCFRMIDWVRGGPHQGEPLQEKILSIQYDPNRSGRIALVASGDNKRYIIATQNMKPGDIIKSTRELTKTAVRPKEGDSHPLGSLPIGSLVNCVELLPDHGAQRARAAGVTAQLIKKQDEHCIVRLPSKQEIAVSPKCVATVGRISNIDHDKRVIGKAGRNRWLGFRPRSGRWHRKDGYFGRKIKPPKRVKVYDRLPETKEKPVPMIFGTQRV